MLASRIKEISVVNHMFWKRCFIQYHNFCRASCQWFVESTSVNMAMMSISSSIPNTIRLPSTSWPFQFLLSPISSKGIHHARFSSSTFPGDVTSALVPARFENLTCPVLHGVLAGPKFLFISQLDHCSLGTRPDSPGVSAMSSRSSIGANWTYIHFRFILYNQPQLSPVNICTWLEIKIDTFSDLMYVAHRWASYARVYCCTHFQLLFSHLQPAPRNALSKPTHNNSP